MGKVRWGKGKKQGKKQDKTRLTRGDPVLIFNGDSVEDHTRAVIPSGSSSSARGVKKELRSLLEKVGVVDKDASSFGNVGYLLSTPGGTDQQLHTDYHTSYGAFEESVMDPQGTCAFSRGKVPMVTLEGPPRAVSRQSALAWANTVLAPDADR